MTRTAIQPQSRTLGLRRGEQLAQHSRLAIGVGGIAGGAILLGSNLLYLTLAAAPALPWMPLLANTALIGGGLMFLREHRRHSTAPSRDLLRSSTTLVLVASLASAACAPRQTTNTVLVQANEYAFTVTDSLPAGPTALGLANAGKVPHEIIVVRLRPDASVQEILRLDREGSSWSALRDAPSGILTADPGVTTPGQLLIDLKAGERYLLVCNFADSESAPPHLHLGMMKLITVHEPRGGA